ncbi:MAG: DUF2752 domain-containing protein [Oculatellaceae cyanobacterium Prado106]|nr:DUF2752 domain-containing protein [Oculatellaceae cyanobacterium Prado106]
MPQSLSSTAQRVRYGVLGLAIAPLLGSFFYGQGYHVPFWGCPIRQFTGVPCPACGMTRSFTAIAQGHLDQAFGYHGFGPVLFVGCGVAIVHLTLELWTGRSIATVYTRLGRSPQVQFTGLALFLGYYGWRLGLLFASGQLQEAVWRSPLGHLLGFS